MKKLLSIYGATALVCTTSAHSALLAYYSFDGDLNDDFGSNDLSAFNVETSTAASLITATPANVKYGSGAMNVTTTERGVLDSTIIFNTGEAWTVSFWAKGEGHAIGLAGLDPIGKNSGLRVRDSNSKFRQKGSGNEGTEYTFNTARNVSTTYNHYIFSADTSNNVTLYVNNVLDGTIATSTTAFHINSIGSAYYSNNAGNFSGQLDEVYIFDEAISASDRTAVFNDTFAVPEPSSTALLGLGGLALILRRRR